MPSKPCSGVTPGGESSSTLPAEPTARAEHRPSAERLACETGAEQRLGLPTPRSSTRGPSREATITSSPTKRTMLACGPWIPTRGIRKRQRPRGHVLPDLSRDQKAAHGGPRCMSGLRVAIEIPRRAWPGDAPQSPRAGSTPDTISRAAAETSAARSLRGNQPKLSSVLPVDGRYSRPT